MFLAVLGYDCAKFRNCMMTSAKLDSFRKRMESTPAPEEIETAEKIEEEKTHTRKIN